MRNRIGAEQKLERYRDQLTREDLLEIYRRMWFARVFDETLYDMKRKRAIASRECVRLAWSGGDSGGYELPLASH
jgi:TPP-dependent pyruvate/acetoin dehydrogenase alpha subunit